MALGDPNNRPEDHPEVNPICEECGNDHATIQHFADGQWQWWCYDCMERDLDE